MRKMSRFLVVLLVIAMLFSTTAFAEAEKVVTMAMTNTWSTFNPFADNGNYSDVLSDQVFDRFWVVNKDGTVEPRLAKSYEVAEDHTHMIIHLDENAKFHDGEPVTADDVIFTAQLDANPEFNSLKRDQLQYVAGTTIGGVCENPDELGFEKIDDYTVKLTFKEPMNELPILTMTNRYFYILPEHIYSQFTMEELNSNETWANCLIGSGPFKYESSIAGDRVEFVANKDYHKGAPDFDRLVIRVVETSQLLSGLLTGEIDIAAGAGIGNLSLVDWPSAQESENLTTVSTSNFAYQGMVINMTSEKIPNAACRNALNMAINRQNIVDYLLLGEGTVIYAPYCNDHPFVDESLLNLPEYNPEKAKAQLEENGFDFDQTLELIVPTGNEVRIQSTILIQQDLAAIGVKVNITQYDFPTLMTMMKEGQCDLAMCGSAGSIEPSEAVGWLNHEGTTNFPCVPDDRFVSLFNEAKGILDLEEQQAKYAEIWQFILDESPVVYLYSANHLVAYNNRISNVDPEKFPQVNWDICSWKVAD